MMAICYKKEGDYILNVVAFQVFIIKKKIFDERCKGNEFF
jgi:hypothetical protein